MLRGTGTLNRSPVFIISALRGGYLCSKKAHRQSFGYVSNEGKIMPPKNDHLPGFVYQRHNFPLMLA